LTFLHAEFDDETDRDHGRGDVKPRFSYWARAVTPHTPTEPQNSTVSVKRNRYPHSIVWSPLPVISWLLPFIGHMGITNSEGIIFDFAGPYSINRDDFAFGSPTRYLQLSPNKAQQKAWDSSVAEGCAIYETRMHNLFCDNCHSHVARCLNAMEFDGKTNWNMVVLCFWILFSAKFTDAAGVVKTVLPTIVIAMLVLIVRFVMIQKA